MSELALEAPDPPVLPWSTFGPILAVNFLGTLGFSLAIPFLVFIVTDLGGASWTYGLVGATYSACQLVGAPVLGRWSDRIGRRPVLILSQVGTLLAWLLFLVALSLPKQELATVAGAHLTVPLVLVFLARALDGATGGNISVANAYVADLTKGRDELRQLAFGRMGMAASLGFVVGPAAAGILGGTRWGPRLPIAAAATFALVTTVAIAALLKPRRQKCPDGGPALGMMEAGLHQQAKPCHERGQPAPPSVKGPPRPVVAVVVGSFLVFLGFNVFYSAFPVHALQVYGWETGRLGLFFAILSGMMFLAQGPLLGWLGPRLSPPVVFALGMALLAGALVLLEAPLPYLGAALFAMGNGIAWPTFQARVAEVAGEQQGAVQGWTTSASSTASILGLLFGGALYPALGGTLFFVASALFGLVLLLTPVWFGRTEA